MSGLNTLRDECLRIATEHGFKDASVPEDIALMHSELSEALEDYRAGHGAADLWYTYKTVEGLQRTVESKDGTPWTFNSDPRLYPLPGFKVKPEGIPSEMADVIIRVLHFCGKHGIDIEAAVKEKMAYNESRPYKHGKII